MKSALTAGLVASALLLQQAAGTGSWGEAPSFSSPSNCNNTCTTDQQSGFDWSSLPAGGFSSYGGFGFNGFTCQNSFQGKSKRSLQTRSGFQSKCIQGSVGKSSSSGPSFSCGKDDAFSITNMQVSVSFDTELDFIFSMPDGSTCKHTASCQSAGTTVENSQCGGAKGVTFQLPPSSGKSSCDVGIHSIGFDCSSSSPPTPPTTSTTTTPVKTTTTPAVGTTTTTTTPVVWTTTSTTTTTTPVLQTTTTTTTPAKETPTTTTTTPAVETTTTTTTPGKEIPTTTTTTTTPGQETTPGTTTTTTTTWGKETPTTTTTTPATTTTTTPGKETPPTTTSTTTTTPGQETSGTTTTTTTPGKETPPTTWTSTTTATTTTTPGKETLSTTTTTTTTPATTLSTTTPNKTFPPTTISSSTTTTISTVPPPPPPESSAPCPSVLPSCLNTWLSMMPSCSSNSDTKCFCPSASFIASVQECVSAWAGSDDEITAALSYLAGICADFVPQNPGICT
ncbi:hypothetical protein LTS06_008236, partial [Exophiala xenobiotica]